MTKKIKQKLFSAVALVLVITFGFIAFYFMNKVYQNYSVEQLSEVKAEINNES